MRPLPICHPAAIFVAGFALSSAAQVACTPFTEDGAGDSGLAGEESGAWVGPDVQVPSISSDAPSADAFEASPVGASPCDLSRPFSSPVRVEGISTPSTDRVVGLRLMPDSLTGYFARQGTDVSMSMDLFIGTRSNVEYPFAAGPLDGMGINTPADETFPTVSGDGLTLFFVRYPIGMFSSAKIQYASRASLTASFAYVGPAPGVNDPSAADDCPFLRQDGKMLYFASSRVPADNKDLYRASWNGQGFDPPTPVSELNTTFDETLVTVTPDDLTVFFSSFRPDATDLGENIWTATRPSTDVPFSTPTIVHEVNSQFDDAPTFITPDGCTLYFTRTSLQMDHPYGSIVPFVARRPAQ